MFRLIQRGQDGVSWPCPKDMPPLIHQLLARRGVASEEEARAFLHPDENQLHDPFLFPDMAAAVSRIHSSLRASVPPPGDRRESAAGV